MSQENTRRAESILNQVSQYKTEHNTHIIDYNQSSIITAGQPAPKVIGSHILPYSWSIWHHSRSKPSNPNNSASTDEASPALDSYLQTTNKIEFINFDDREKSCEINSIEQLWSCLSILKNPFQLPIGTEFLIFKSGVNPVWEDPINSKGGRWVFRFSRRLNNSNNSNSNSNNNNQQDLIKIRKRTSLIWERLLLRTLGGSLIPQQSEFSNLLLNDITGLVLSVRKDEDIISIWNSNLNFNKKNQLTEDEEELLASTSTKKKEKKLTSFLARRIICDSILRIIRECDLILQGSDAIETIDSGSNDRVFGVSFEYRLHADNNTTNYTSNRESHHSHNSHHHSTSNTNNNNNHSHSNNRSYTNSRRYNKFKDSSKEQTNTNSNGQESTIDKLINTNDTNFFTNLGRRRNDDESGEMGLLSFGKRRLQQQKERLDDI